MSFTTKRGSATLLGKLASVCAVSLLMTVLLASVSPELHHLFHSDSADDAHECVVTAFAHGEGVSLPVHFVFEPVAFRAETALLPTVERAIAQFEYRLQPTCGPPATSHLV
jgi:hypothetical protein